MKRYLILTVAVLVVLAVTLGVYAQEQGEGRGAGAGERMRGFGRRNTEQQQAAITAIEAQLAKLKENMEAQAAMPRFRRPEEGDEMPSEEEIAKMREQRMKMREQQQAVVAAIEDQVKILKGGQLQVEHQADIDELQAIADSATKEKAKSTAKLVQDLIAKRTKAFQDTVQKLGIRLRRQRGRGEGGMGGGQRQGGQGGGGQQ